MNVEVTGKNEYDVLICVIAVCVWLVACGLWLILCIDGHETFN
jgi:hypothetical protein